ncbi:MAG TPA: ATP-binding protein [Candidatus Dormibacteraeota bacterium]|nr:ATP-binding protein [Candidatus Dormibacteraeota bacterium]
MRSQPWRPFLIGAVLAVVAAVAFTSVLVFRPWGGYWVTAVDDIGEAVAALIAAACCAWVATRTEKRLRVGWTLLAVSAASWCAGEVIWSIYEVGLGVAVPFPSLADFGFLVAVPFAAAGIWAFWARAPERSSRWLVWVEGLVVIVSLTFTGWAFGLKDVYLTSGDSLLERMVGLAYPAGDILIGTILILGLRRASHQQQGRMLLLLGGLAALAISDSVFAYLNSAEVYGVQGSVIDAGWVVGYLLIALAALWPSAKTDDASAGMPIDPWQVATPWSAVILAAAAAVITGLQGHPPDLFMIGLAASLGVLLMMSQVLMSRDSLALVLASRRSESTLAETMAHTPAGVVRVGPDLRVISANPRAVAFLPHGDSIKAATLLTSYFEASESPGIVAKLALLGPGLQDAVEDDSHGRSLAGTKVWIHWSATRVLKASGSTDYFIVMLEDTTARHEDEAAAIRSLEVLDKLNRLKTDFLQNVSHEFKTALIGIEGFSELIRDSTNLNVREAQDFAADIYRGAERLDKMLTEMLDLDRVETGRAILRLAATDLNALIVREVEEVKQGVDGISVVLALDAMLPPVVADEGRLAEVIMTLLKNASRYSPDGGRITVTSLVDAAEVEVSVMDEGIGARADFDNRLFGAADLYAENPIRKVVGTGLGLGIARRVIEMHGGRLWVDRLEGIGSVFHFRVPIQQPRSQPVIAGSGPVHTRVA